MRLVNTHEAKTQLSKLLDAVAKGEVIRICRNGVPIAQLTGCIARNDPLKTDKKLSPIEFHGDPSLPTEPEGW